MTKQIPFQTARIPDRCADDNLIYENRTDHRAEGEEAARCIINRMRARLGLPTSLHFLQRTNGSEVTDDA